MKKPIRTFKTLTPEESSTATAQNRYVGKTKAPQQMLKKEAFRETDAELLAERKRKDTQSQSITSLLNPKNWGVSDYSNQSDFPKAYSSAKMAGEKEFMHNGKRYNTNYAGTPRQEVGRYGVDGKTVTKTDLKNTADVFQYPIGDRKYKIGHIGSRMGDIGVSTGPFGNGVLYRNKEEEEIYMNKKQKSYNVYGVNRQNYNNIAAEKNENKKKWNLFTNNCADATCDAFGVKRAFIETPNKAVDQIKDKYNVIETTGRRKSNFINNQINKLDDDDELLTTAKQSMGDFSSPEFDIFERMNNIRNIQRVLVDKGYKLPNSTINESNSFGGLWTDGIYGSETKTALEHYLKNKKDKPESSTTANKKSIVQLRRGLRYN